MVPDVISHYLDEHEVPFRVAMHSPRMTAQETAAITHIPGKRFAKTVVLRSDGHYVMAVVPADESVDLGRFRDALHRPLELASEEEVGRLFPNCETGAMPPLGGLFGMPVVVDACLASQESIAVNGGTHTDVIELRWRDYERSEHPHVLEH
jgi:Ala-tRNA(Pro) deacylase